MKEKTAGVPGKAVVKLSAEVARWVFREEQSAGRRAVTGKASGAGRAPRWGAIGLRGERAKDRQGESAGRKTEPERAESAIGSGETDAEVGRDRLP